MMPRNGLQNENIMVKHISQTPLPIPQAPSPAQPTTQKTGNVQPLHTVQKRIKPHRPAPPPPQKTLAERTVKTPVKFEQKIDLQPAQKVQNQAKKIVQRLLTHVSGTHTGKERYLELVQLKQRYTAHQENASPADITLQNAIVGEINEHIQQHHQQTLEHTSQQTTSTVHHQQHQSVTTLKEAIIDGHSVKKEVEKQKLKEAINTPTSFSSAEHTPALSAGEQFTVDTVSNQLINQCFQRIFYSNDAAQQLSALSELQSLYQLTDGQIDPDAASDIEQGILNITKQYGTTQSSGVLTQAILTKINTFLQTTTLRLEWKTASHLPPLREGPAFTQHLSACKTIQELTKAATSWTDQHVVLTPPEEKILESYTRKFLVQAFCDATLKPLPNASTAENALDIADFIVQLQLAQSDAEGKQAARPFFNLCKLHPALFNMLGQNLTFDAPETRLQPFMDAATRDVLAQAEKQLNTSVTQLTQQVKGRGKKKKPLITLLPLKEKHAFYKKQLLSSRQTRLEKASPQAKKEILQDIEDKADARIQHIKDMFHQRE